MRSLAPPRLLQKLRKEGQHIKQSRRRQGDERRNQYGWRNVPIGKPTGTSSHDNNPDFRSCGGANSRSPGLQSLALASFLMPQIDRRRFAFSFGLRRLGSRRKLS